MLRVSLVPLLLEVDALHLALLGLGFDGATRRGRDQRGQLSWRSNLDKAVRSLYKSSATSTAQYCPVN